MARCTAGVLAHRTAEVSLEREPVEREAQLSVIETPLAQKAVAWRCPLEDRGGIVGGILRYGVLLRSLSHCQLHALHSTTGSTRGEREQDDA